MATPQVWGPSTVNPNKPIFLTNVVEYAGECHPDMFYATAWLSLSGPQGMRALEAHRRSSLGGMGHACEVETSLISI